MLGKNEVNEPIWDDVYLNKSSTEFVHLIQIPMANNQTPSTYLSSLCPGLITQWC